MPGRLTLVTGAPGWLGSRLVRVLAHGLPDVPALAEPDRERRIRCLVMPGAPADALTRIAPGVELVSGDIRDPPALRDLCRGGEGATFFHLCGIIHPRRVGDFYAINVDGTRNALAAAMAAGVRRLVAVSSNSPAGANPHPDHCFDEASPYRPYRHYGESERQMEALVAEAEATGRPWFGSTRRHRPPVRELLRATSAADPRSYSSSSPRS
jgi:nucleoside-diphosphate-sugar epimerase